MQGAATGAIHQRNGDQSHNNLGRNNMIILSRVSRIRLLDSTIMAPMPIVANLALSSVSPELMKSDVE